MVYFIDASYIFSFFFFSKLDLVLFQKTVSLALILQGSLGSTWTAPVLLHGLVLTYHPSPFFKYL